jgi:putative FmdB family regulatory protein
VYMPIYEYKCQQCGLHFERFQRMSDAPVQACPQCSGQVRRVMQAVGIVFKGSGFYSTDNRKTSTLGSAGSNHKDANGTPTKETGEATETAKSTVETSKDTAEKPAATENKKS